MAGFAEQDGSNKTQPSTSMIPLNSSSNSSLAINGRMGSRRRSGTASSSSSGSTTGTTTMTVVRSSKPSRAVSGSGSPVMSIQIPSPSLSINNHYDQRHLSPDEVRSPSSSQTASPTDTVREDGTKQRPRPQERRRSNSSVASYNRSPSSYTVVSSSALSRSARSTDSTAAPFHEEATGSAPAGLPTKTSSVPIVRQTSRLDKGKGPAVIAEGSWISLTSDNPFKRPTPRKLPTELEVKQKAKLKITTSISAAEYSYGNSPVTPYTPEVGDSSTNKTLRPALPYRVPSFSKSEPVLDLGLRLTELAVPSIHDGTTAAGSLRLPLTPLEEINSPLMTFDSPADLAEVQDPFSARALQEALLAAKTQEQDETFYHALLEIVRTEDGYTADLTDLVEVHFSLLSFARFVTEEQRVIIIRDAVKLLEIHQRLQAKLQRVEEDLGWIRDDVEVATLDEDGSALSTPVVRFKSSDATVADAARRIAAIYLNEAQNLSEAYQPFCSAHVEAMDILKMVSTQRLDWDVFEAQCTSHLALRKSASTRLHFADFLIKPVQRICRYPMLFAALLKHAQKQHVEYSWDRLEEVTDAMKVVAAEVDEAQKQRSLEIATVKLALRMDIQTPAQRQLLNHLERVVMVGSAHVIYTNTSPLPLPASGSNTVKASFYGLVLYSTHLLFVKAKKTNLYEPRHWLPLRLFDMYKIPDGDGLLPYAIRMTYREHNFEIGSLCHQEQNLLAEAIETASFTCRQKWIDAIANNPIAPALFDETLVCSEAISDNSLPQAASPQPSEVASGILPSPEPSLAKTASVSAVSSDTESTITVRPRLSLKPPAQRVATDLRLADLLSDAILTARAQSKRSHAMPLHGPPPRSLSAVSGSSHSRRPHSFHTGSFSYRSIMDSTISSRSRRNSTVESDNGRPESQHRSSMSLSTIDAGNAVASVAASPQIGSPDRKPTKLARSRTSTSNSETLMMKPTRTGTLSRLRRRATSMYPEQAPSKAVADLRQQHQDEQPIQAAGEAGNATVARNSSTSSSSSCGSASTNPSNTSSSIETPQSSLPASPLLTPVDLESSTRWSKFGDAIAQSLTRKRSFASSRPLLAVQPEPLLEGAQLERAQQAAEYIYTGNSSTSSQSGHGEYYNPRRTSSSHSHERRYSWDKFGWSGKGTSALGSMLDHGERHYTSVSVGGRSAPNLFLSTEKRQSSSGSLWSVFGRDGVSYTSSPTPSIYESAHEEEGNAVPSYSPGGESITASSPQEVTPTSSPPLATGASLPLSISNTSPFAPPPQLRRQPSLPVAAPNAPAQNSKTGSAKITRRNSITARLRAFKTLGSSMTPLASSSASPSSRHSSQ